MIEKMKDLTDSQKIERNSESFNFRKLLIEGIANFANDLNKNLDKDLSPEIRVVIFEATFKECLDDVVMSLKWSKGYIEAEESEQASPNKSRKTFKLTN